MRKWEKREVLSLYIAMSPSTSSLWTDYTLGYITLKVSSSKLTGYDYESGSCFLGTINPHCITIYDYETGAYYDLSCWFWQRRFGIKEIK